MYVSNSQTLNSCWEMSWNGQKLEVNGISFAIFLWFDIEQNIAAHNFIRYTTVLIIIGPRPHSIYENEFILVLW